MSVCVCVVLQESCERKCVMVLLTSPREQAVSVPSTACPTLRTHACTLTYKWTGTHVLTHSLAWMPANDAGTQTADPVRYSEWRVWFKYTGSHKRTTEGLCVFLLHKICVNTIGADVTRFCNLFRKDCYGGVKLKKCSCYKHKLLIFGVPLIRLQHVYKDVCKRLNNEYWEDRKAAKLSISHYQKASLLHLTPVKGCRNPAADQCSADGGIVVLKQNTFLPPEQSFKIF